MLQRPAVSQTGNDTNQYIRTQMNENKGSYTGYLRKKEAKGKVNSFISCCILSVANPWLTVKHRDWRDRSFFEANSQTNVYRKIYVKTV